MGDTRQNKTIAGAGNSIYAAQAGESPGPESSEDRRGKTGARAGWGTGGQTDNSGEESIARQEGHSTIASHDLDRDPSVPPAQKQKQNRNLEDES